ncbi:hematopoietic progenitor cell antigen CD34 isoform X2 [Antennarius striatus]|uniref:hematopoietic progenitor cell antigen CD34 isoform X2 n=1 Tax=Antennarius striatus TaxID=241820 RepID=UPI0035B2DC09
MGPSLFSLQRMSVKLISSHAKVMANEEEIVSMTIPPVEAEAQIRGDMIPEMTEAHGPEDQQVLVFPSVGTLEPTAASQTEAGDQNDGVAPEKVADNTVKANTDVPKVIEAETPAPMPARGDGPNNKPKLLPLDGVVCVGKEAIQDKNGVNLKLKAASNCENSKAKIESVLQELCDRDCKLEIFQEDNTDEIIVSGQYVEADVSGMTKKFNNDNIKIKTDVEEAAPRWERNSKLVLVSMLLSGLLLAAFLVSGYYLKTHRKNSKGVRLAESFQVDDENQANTLVSVAPLPQEPLDKPVVNGESPPENGNNPTPTTNGHSATQLPVADTEM